jgi:hypothetical protein
MREPVGRGAASGGAPFRLLATAAVLAFAIATPASARVTRRARPAPPPPPQPLAFAAIAWDVDARTFARSAEARGYHAAAAPVGATEYRGLAFARRAAATPEYDAAGRLVAVSVRFDADSRSGPLQRYAAVVDAVKRRHGPWATQVDPGRPVVEVRHGELGVTRKFGPLTAATLWTGEDGAAAAVQLDGDGVLWLRYESPRWAAAHAEPDTTR